MCFIARQFGISHVAVGDEQSLMVSWMVNHSDSVADVNAIQISRTIIHNVSAEVLFFSHAVSSIVASQ